MGVQATLRLGLSEAGPLITLSTAKDSWPSAPPLIVPTTISCDIFSRSPTLNNPSCAEPLLDAPNRRPATAKDCNHGRRFILLNIGAPIVTNRGRDSAFA